MTDMKRRSVAPRAGRRSRLRGPGRAGCVGVVIALALVLLGGFIFLNPGVRWTMRRARKRLEQALPQDLPASDRSRLDSDLDRFFAVVAHRPHSTRRMGQFLGRVERILDDGRVTIPEVHELTHFLERRSSRPAAGKADG